MRIIIDGRMLYWTGVGRYITALLEELQIIDSENEYFVLIRRKDWDKWAPSVTNFIKVEVSIDPYTFGEQVLLPKILRGLKPDLIHFTTPNTPLLWFGRRVVTVHDLTLIDFNTSRHIGLRRAAWEVKRITFRLLFWNNARFATMLLTDTKYVSKQLQDRYHVSAARMSVALLSADPNLAAAESTERFGRLGQYLFYVGNMYPYKNIASTIQALAKLKNYPDLKLIIAGKRDVFSQKLELEASDLCIGDRVKFVGYVNDGEMISLYKSAALYVNPSLSEGFGLQGLEAMAHGTPVVAARASCLPEVYGDAAEYFDPYDALDQARAIALVLDDAVARKRLSAAGTERVKAFSWKKMATETLAVYRSAGQ